MALLYFNYNYLY